jgi:hypothetical protein
LPNGRQQKRGKSLSAKAFQADPGTSEFFTVSLQNLFLQMNKLPATSLFMAVSWFLDAPSEGF